MKIYIAIALSSFYIFIGCSTDTAMTEQTEHNDAIYFPALETTNWETESITNLGWNNDALQPLLNFLTEKNTKGFMVLHNGKIVIEAYMNGHDATKPWYWASAGKTLTSSIAGIAQDEGLIDLNDNVSRYIGEGWTSAPIEKENLITCKNLLAMDSGLDDSLGDNVSKENLVYKADAGTRWAYHNVYKKMQDVVSAASGQSWDNYFNTKLKSKIGMNGSWIQNTEFNVYWSDTRSMARFGLLIYAKGKWQNTQIIPESFLVDATNTSQNINLSYGYLWWLNGKSSYHLPASQAQFNGELIPNAPADMFAALGRDDQKIYIVPSKKLVVVRTGNAADSLNFALSNFDNALWEKINALVNK